MRKERMTKIAMVAVILTVAFSGVSVVLAGKGGNGNGVGQNKDKGRPFSPPVHAPNGNSSHHNS